MPLDTFIAYFVWSVNSALFLSTRLFGTSGVTCSWQVLLEVLQNQLMRDYLLIQTHIQCHIFPPSHLWWVVQWNKFYSCFPVIKNFHQILPALTLNVSQPLNVSAGWIWLKMNSTKNRPPSMYISANNIKSNHLWKIVAFSARHHFCVLMRPFPIENNQS